METRNRFLQFPGAQRQEEWTLIFRGVVHAAAVFLPNAAAVFLPNCTFGDFTLVALNQPH